MSQQGIETYRVTGVQHVLAELSDNPVELLHRKLDGSLGGPIHVVAVVFLDTL
jgi:hypothetical protein